MKRTLPVHRKSAPQGFRERGSVGPGEFIEAAHNFILRQHCQLVNANCRGCSQAGLAPLVNGDIENGYSETRRSGSGNEIVVSRVQEDRGRTQLAARRLVEADPGRGSLNCASFLREKRKRRTLISRIRV